MNTYCDADPKNSRESTCIIHVALHQEDFFLNPWVPHCIEDGHAEPEPNIERSEHPTEVAALFKAAHARSYGHYFAYLTVS